MDRGEVPAGGPGSLQQTKIDRMALKKGQDDEYRIAI
jgi:hypothetical protein